MSSGDLGTQMQSLQKSPFLLLSPALGAEHDTKWSEISLLISDSQQLCLCHLADPCAPPVSPQAEKASTLSAAQ